MLKYIIINTKHDVSDITIIAIINNIASSSYRDKYWNALITYKQKTLSKLNRIRCSPGRTNTNTIQCIQMLVRCDCGVEIQNV